MKVLKRPDSQWSYKHTCTECSAELEVEKSDVKYSYFPGSYNPSPGCGNEDSLETWKAKCPVCGDTFDVPPNTMPKIVQVEIRKGVKDNSYAGPYGGPLDR